MEEYLGTEPRFIEIRDKLVNPNMIICIERLKLVKWNDETERPVCTSKTKLTGINIQNEEGYETHKYILGVSMVDGMLEDPFEH